MTEKTKVKLDKVKKAEKKKGGAGELTDEEREAVTIVFHQFETGLREGTIFTKVKQKNCSHLTLINLRQMTPLKNDLFVGYEVNYSSS